MNRFQKTYLFIFMFSIIGLAGNIELGADTPIYSWLILSISGFFTIGKMIYWIKKGV